MFLTGVISHLCRCRDIIKHTSTKPVVSVDFLTHVDSSPDVNVKCELLNGVGGRGVSHWSQAVLHCSLASGARQVKHNKLQLSQTYGIIYLDPSQSVWLNFSNTLHFPVPVAPHHPSMSVPITPASLVTGFCWREHVKERFSFSFLSSSANTIYYVSFFKKTEAIGTKRDSVKSQATSSQTSWTFVCCLWVKGCVFLL